jgi:hypothetical protein
MYNFKKEVSKCAQGSQVKLAYLVNILQYSGKYEFLAWLGTLTGA